MTAVVAETVYKISNLEAGIMLAGVVLSVGIVIWVMSR